MVLPSPNCPSKVSLIHHIEAHLGLLEWRSTSGYSLAYGQVAGYRIAAGEPQCAPEMLSVLLHEFEQDSNCDGRKVVYFGMSSNAIQSFDPQARRGLAHLGDLPVFDLKRWASPALLPRSIRAQTHRAVNHGITVRHLSLRPSDPGDLNACLQAWLSQKGMPPMAFATNPFLLDPWPRHGVFIAEKDGRICGFTLFSSSLFRDMARIDAVVRAPGAPNGCAELLVAAAFQHMACLGFARATLGLAPLARISGMQSVSPGWFRSFSTLARSAAFPFYSFAGLEAFKAKFHPDEWQPLYGISQGERFTLRDFLAVLRAFAGGSLIRYGLRSLKWKVGFTGSIKPNNDSSTL